MQTEKPGYRAEVHSQKQAALQDGASREPLHLRNQTA